MFKNNKYPNPKVAMQQRDGLAILAFFLKVSERFGIWIIICQLPLIKRVVHSTRTFEIQRIRA